MKPFRAVIFDMDGVIVDSEPLHKEAFHAVLDDLGYGRDLARLGLNFDDYIGRSDFVLWQDFVARHHPPQTMEELITLKRDLVVAMIRRQEPLFDGLPELVASLAPRWPLAVASGSERAVIDAVLEIGDLRRHFGAVVSASEVTHGKPAPDIFLLAANRLGVPPEDCVVIEDSKPGVAAGLAAGMQVIAVTNTHPADELAQAHHVVQHYAELRRLRPPDP
jgi:beta-phosphoglucomutase family hydrolase